VSEHNFGLLWRNMRVFYSYTSDYQCESWNRTVTEHDPESDTSISVRKNHLSVNIIFSLVTDRFTSRASPKLSIVSLTLTKSVDLRRLVHRFHCRNCTRTIRETLRPHVSTFRRTAVTRGQLATGVCGKCASQREGAMRGRRRVRRKDVQPDNAQFASVFTVQVAVVSD
jgi:hypothetical protein